MGILPTGGGFLETLAARLDPISKRGNLADIVHTRQGSLEGVRGSGSIAFKGVPFAKPPVGPLRFRPPEPPDPWTGVRRAETAGCSSPQVAPVNRTIRTLIGVAGSRQSQDCLYLNVWTPRADDGRRPVMVWIHGGAFILGSGATRMYDGSRLASRGDVVVVTINYRLGALGFLDWQSIAPSSERPPSNLGIRDQVAALEWVRDNIEALGGDPENVTIFGESAGAMSTSTLLGVPAARGLFHKAIAQSGAAHNVSRPEKAARVAESFAEALGLDRLDFESLERLTVSEVMGAQARASVKIGLNDGMMAWQPSVDGDFIPEQPLAAIEGGAASGIPLLIGTNRDEFKLFTFTNRERLTDQELLERVDRIAARCDFGDASLVDRVQGSYGTRVGDRNPGANTRWVEMQSDRIFHYPATRLADVHAAQGAPTWSYLFKWRPPLLGRSLGSCHGLEIPFVFGTVKSTLGRIGLVADRVAGPLCDYMQDAWIAFARTGDPGAGRPESWPAYGLKNRDTMSLGRKRRILKDPHEAARRFWEPLIPDGEVPMATPIRIAGAGGQARLVGLGEERTTA